MFLRIWYMPYLISHVRHVLRKQEEAIHGREHGAAVARAQHRVHEVHDLESLVLVRSLVPDDVIGANIKTNKGRT